MTLPAKVRDWVGLPRTQYWETCYQLERNRVEKPDRYERAERHVRAIWAGVPEPGVADV